MTIRPGTIGPVLAAVIAALALALAAGMMPAAAGPYDSAMILDIEACEVSTDGGTQCRIASGGTAESAGAQPIPWDFHTIDIELWGAGGGGGGGGSVLALGSRGGGGGGGGGYTSIELVRGVHFFNDYCIEFTVGTGGVGGNGSLDADVNLVAEGGQDGGASTVIIYEPDCTTVFGAYSAAGGEGGGSGVTNLLGGGDGAGGAGGVGDDFTGGAGGGTASGLSDTGSGGGGGGGSALFDGDGPVGGNGTASLSSPLFGAIPGAGGTPGTGDGGSGAGYTLECDLSGLSGIGLVIAYALCLVSLGASNGDLIAAGTPEVPGGGGGGGSFLQWAQWGQNDYRDGAAGADGVILATWTPRPMITKEGTTTSPNTPYTWTITIDNSAPGALDGWDVEITDPDVTLAAHDDCTQAGHGAPIVCLGVDAGDIIELTVTRDTVITSCAALTDTNTVSGLTMTSGGIVHNDVPAWLVDVSTTVSGNLLLCPPNYPSTPTPTPSPTASPTATPTATPAPGCASPTTAPATWNPTPVIPGNTISTWGGGNVSEFPAPNATSYWTTVNAQWIGYIWGAPDWVNTTFMQTFPNGDVPACTPFVVHHRP